MTENRLNQPPLVFIDSSDPQLVTNLSLGLRGHGIRVLQNEEPAGDSTSIVWVVDEPDERELTAQLPQIFLVGAAREPVLTAAIEYGAAAVFIKPIALDALIAGVRVAAHRAWELLSLRARTDKLSSAIAQDQRVSTVVGIIMERYHLTSREAQERLRRHARNRRAKLPQVAEEILGSLQAADQVLRSIVNSPLHPALDQATE